MPRYHLPDGSSVFTENEIPDDKLPDFFKAMGAEGHIQHPETNPIPEEKKSLWQSLSQPLTDLPSRAAKGVADYIDSPSLNRSPALARISGFAGGAVEGLGDLASSLTSPLDLATTIATAGEGMAARRGLKTVAKGAGYLGKLAGTAMAGHGGYKVIDPNSTLGERGQGLMEMMGGIMGMRGNLHNISKKSTTYPKGWAPGDLKSKAGMSGAPSSREMPKEIDFDMRKHGGAAYEESLMNEANDEITKTRNLEFVDPDMPPNERLIKLAAQREAEAAGITGAGKTGKLKLGTNKDGTFTNLETGEILTKEQLNMKQNPGSIVDPDAPVTGKRGSIKLTSDLSGAKPRFNIGMDSYSPNFASDVDKAAYILAQTNPSKRDADYLKFVMNATGLDESGARALGKKIKAHVKSTLKEHIQDPEHTSDFDIPEFRGEKMGSTIDEPISTSNETPRQMKARLIKEGKKVPILEEEVGITQPTAGRARQQLGPNVDQPQNNPLLEAWNLGRGLMSSVDLSAPFRQGIGLVHKKEFWEAIPAMMKSWNSEAGFEAVQKAIADKPLFKKRIGPRGKELQSFAEQAGVALTDLHDLTRREEGIVSTWAQKIPGVRASNRAYTAFLNKLRADTFESLMESGKVFGADGTQNIPLARELANFVNVATGRGSFGKLESAANALNQVAFSPRLIKARLELPTMLFRGSSLQRREALKSLGAIAVFGNTISQASKLIGGSVSMDPSSADFGKAKIGKLRIDPWAGFQQYAVAVNRLANPLGPVTGFRGNTPFTRGQMVTSSTSGKQSDLWNPKGPFAPSHLDVAARFARGKAHPMLGFIISLMDKQREMSGEKMNFKTLNPMENAIAQRFIPILMQDIYSLAKEDPKSIWAAVPSALGVGMQNYEDQRFAR